MMKRALSYAALAASLMAVPTAISAQQTYDTAYDVYYYSINEYHFSNIVGIRRGICDPNGGATSYMESGYQTVHEEWVAVAQCPVD